MFHITFDLEIYDPIKNLNSKLKEDYLLDQELILKSEWAYCLNDGPGVFIVKGAYTDLTVIDRSTAVFQEIVQQERESSQGKGDHFGENERIWNSLQKSCVHDPELFIAYYGNPILRLASEAWLGPHYRITAQMNNVKPGNAAQSAHRDPSIRRVVLWPGYANKSCQMSCS